MNPLPKLGVIGFPIGHSKSPLIYNYWFEKYDVKADYQTYKVSSDELENFINNLKNNGFIGLNVTVPHKVAVMKFLDDISDYALKAGAVNVITIKNGKLYGHNTDGIGFLENIVSVVPNFDIKKSVVTVLGTGGASRGICAAMMLQGAKKINLVYRSLDKAENLAKSIGGQFDLIDWKGKESVLSQTDLLANATTLGMTGFDELEIDLSTLKSTAIVTDLVYVPRETFLLKNAKEQGFVTVDGLGMLLHQACPAFESWFDIKPVVTKELRQKVL